MKPLAIALLLAAIAAPIGGQRASDSAQAGAVPEIEFDSIPDFLKLPDGMNFGEVSGVAVNSKGNVFVFTRSNSAGGPAYAPAAAQLLEFGPTGKFLREVGKGLYAWSFAHTVRIDKDDNIWAVDKGSDMVVKFNPAGRVVMVFGRRRDWPMPRQARGNGRIRRWLTWTECSGSRPTWPGTPTATATSATATSIPASPSSIATATG